MNFRLEVDFILKETKKKQEKNLKSIIANNKNKLNQVEEVIKDNMLI